MEKIVDMKTGVLIWLKKYIKGWKFYGSCSVVIAEDKGSIDETVLQKQIQLMDDNPQVIGCYSDCEYIDQANCNLEDVCSVSKIQNGTFYDKLLLGGNFVCFPFLLI